MAYIVVMGALLSCGFGVVPSQLAAVTSQASCFTGGQLTATIQDSQPVIHIAPFGMCTSLANPTVASATAAALGVLTPMPCVPAPAGPWICPGTSFTCGIPTLTSDGKLVCAYGGIISVTYPGQVTVTIN